MFYKKICMTIVLLCAGQYAAARIYPEGQPVQQEIKQVSNAPLEYAYVYSYVPVDLNRQNPMPFDSNGPMTSGITHVLGSSEIVFKKAGVYQVNFAGLASVNGDKRTSQVSLFLNNQRVITGSDIYGSSFSPISIMIQGIITVNAGDTLTVKKEGQSEIRTSYNGASLVIKQLASQ